MKLHTSAQWFFFSFLQIYLFDLCVFLDLRLPLFSHLLNLKKGSNWCWRKKTSWFSLIVFIILVITDFLFRVANHSWNLRSRWRFLFDWPMRCGEFLLELKNSEQSYLQNSVWWGAWRIGVNVSRFMWNKVSIVKEADLANHLQYKYFKISSLYSSCQTEAIVEAFIAIAWDKFLRTFTRLALQKIVSLMKFGFNWIISHDKKVQLLDWVFRILLTVFNGMNEKRDALGQSSIIVCFYQSISFLVDL